MKSAGRVLVALCLLLSLFSCGGGGKKLVFMMWGDAEELKTVKGYLKKFAAKHPDIGMPKVIHMTPFAYWDKFQVMIAAGETPDVFYMGNEEIRAYEKQGVLLDLSPLIEKDKFDIDDFFPILVEGFRIDGKQFGIPKDFTPLVLYYNMDMFKKKGIPMPDDKWTWHDLRNAAKSLTIKTQGKVEVYGFVVEDWASWMPAWVWSNGGKYMEDGKWVFGKPPYLERNAQTYDYLVGLMLRDNAAPDVGTRKQMGGSEGFASRKVAMCVLGRWAMLQNRHIKSFRWNVAPIPRSPYTGKRMTSLFTAAYSIAKTTRQKDAAWTLVKYLTGKKAQQAVAASGLAVPSRKSIAYSSEFLDSAEIEANQRKLNNRINHKVFLDGVEYGKLPPSHPNWLKIRDKLSMWFQTVFIGTRPAKEVLRKTQPRFEAMMR